MPASRQLVRLGLVLLLAGACAPVGCSKGRQPPAPPVSDGEPNAPAAAPKPAIVIDRAARRVSVPARVVEQGTRAELKGAIEYVLVHTEGKAYETVFATDHTPREVHDALAAIGLRRGTPATEDAPPRGRPVRLFVVSAADAAPRRTPADRFVATLADGRPLQPVEWVYTGSTDANDLATGRKVLQADLTGSIIGLHRSDASPLVQNPRGESVRENIYRANPAALPPPGTAVRIVFERVMPQVPPGTRRARVLISGRVQGVGFRVFAQRQARLRKLTGFVRNLPDGRVEAVVEGPAGKVAEMLTELKRGPRPARVERMDVTDEQPEVDYQQFEILY